MSAFSQVSNDNEDEVYKIDEQAGKNDFVPGQVLVKFKDGNPVTVSKTRGMVRSVSNENVDAVLKEFGVETMDMLLPTAKPKQTRGKTRAYNSKEVEEKDLSQLYTLKLKTHRKDSTMMLVSKLKELDEVEYAEPNYKIYMMGQVPMVMPDTPDAPAMQAKPSQAHTTRTTDNVICANPEQNPLYAQQWGISYLKINELWNKPIINSKRPVIAILDTGVDITHPDLVDNIWTKPGTEDEHGYDFINETYNIRDYNSHGTHVAGIAAASNNETGIIGANPQALIMPITVMQSDGTGDIQVLIKGIQYAIDNGADVINMSLGTYAQSLALREILMTAYQNAVLVASAGNDANPLNECVRLNAKGYSMYPAAYPFVLGVQSGSSGVLDGFSNRDCNGPTYSEYKLYDGAENYELIAPGSGIVSCIPYGKYKSLNGTSMSSPLIAGAISTLKMVKEYNNQEILWGDLIHTDCNFESIFNISERKADLEIIALNWDDQSDDGNGDGFYDAGETVRFYPVIRTIWGEANNIKCHLDLGDYEDGALIEILQNDIDFGWDLSSYAYETGKNPIIFKIADDCPDSRRIKLRLTVICDGALNPSVTRDFVIGVNNIIKLQGLQEEDKTLTANHKYLVSGNYAIMDGATLTIEPGTHVMFRKRVEFRSDGKLIAKGEPGNMIKFTRYPGDSGPYNLIFNADTLSYCIIEGAGDESRAQNSYSIQLHPSGDWQAPGSVLKDCILDNNKIESTSSSHNVVRCNVRSLLPSSKDYYLCNLINGNHHAFQWDDLNKNNCLNNVINDYDIDVDYEHYLNTYTMLDLYSPAPSVQTNSDPSYLGSSREDIIRPHVHDMNYGDGVGYGYGVVDLSNMLTEPVQEAHGMIWKVLVDGVDPQDEYEIMPPLGVGKHKFEVYFNRPMNKNVIPNIAFGVRLPYNQNAVNENGSWNKNGTIYTAYKTITGKTQSDGMNRIYVWGAEDQDFFECPYENLRFKINIQSAGSLATGFAASAGMGKVNLIWDNTNNDFDDAMGYNIYRYTIDQEGKADTICINKEIVDIETTEFTDYDVIPGTTYYYLYRVLSTGLKEYDVSNVVSATPLTSTLGDANGSGDVDVVDVITTVNYAAGQNPKPFIFEAADVNVDKAIDILDVVGIIQKVLNPVAGARAVTEVAATAEYSIEDGILYVDSSVDLGGVQVMLNLDPRKSVTVSDDLEGFEHTSAWLSDNDYMFMAYNMNGKTLSAGKHALLRIGDAEVSDLILSTISGKPVYVHTEGTTAIKTVETKTQKVKGVFNLMGHKMADNASDLEKLPKGIYIIDGEKVVK